jgi:basic membrane protein A and related proteins
MRTVSGAALAAIAVLAVGCGGGSNSGGGGSATTAGASAPKIKATWLYAGPADDGGYNTSYQVTMNRLPKEFAGKVTTQGIFNVPYSQRAAQITEQAIANGANVLVDTLGLGTLFTDVCKKYPKVKCFPAVDVTPPPANTQAWFLDDWNSEYIGGVAAGLSTKSGTVGWVGSFDSPVVRMAANTFAMGCQRARPDCKVRAVFTNSYFDPPKSNQAYNTLVDSGADVLRNWVDDPGFCQVAERRGVKAVGAFWDFKSTCPKSIVTSTVWNFDDYFAAQTKQILDGSFKGGDLDLIKVGTTPGAPHLGAWGDAVPAAVRTKTEQIYNEIVNGKNVMVGPLYDQRGRLRVKAGEQLTPQFMLSKWTWFVRGVIGGGGGGG